MDHEGLSLERWSYVHDEHLRGAAAQREMVQSLLEQVAGGRWPENLAAAVSDITGRAAAVADDTGRVLGAAGGSSPPPPERHRPPDHTDPRRWQDGWWACRAPGPDPFAPVVWLEDVAKEARPAELLMLEAAARVAMMEARQAHAVATAELRMWGDFAAELLDDADPARIEAHARALAYDLDRPHRVALLEARQGSIDEGALRQRLRALAPDAVPVRQGDRIAVIHPGEPTWDAVVAALEATAGTGRVRVGVSARHDDAHRLRDALAEAEMSLELGRALGDPQLVRYDDLGVVRLLAGGNDVAELERFVLDAIGPLAAYDAAHGTELLRTLDAWLERSGSLDHLADSLAIHRSTLAYRLRRIEELLDRDLADPGARLELTIAARAAFVLRAVSGNPDWPVELAGARRGARR